MRVKLLSIVAATGDRAPLVAGLIAVVFCAVGCQRKGQVRQKLPTYPVHGQLSIDGEPAAGAMVKFYSKQSEGRVPTAIVRPDGSFSASFYDREDGAPAGVYSLLVVWMETPPQGGMAHDKLRGQFLDPSKAVATVTIAQGVNNLEPITIFTSKHGVPSPTR